MTRFLLTRHGNTPAVGHYLAGTAPGTHLDDIGRAQVQRLVERLHDVRLRAVISSPLERARETAEPIARDHQLDVEIVPAFIEYEIGAWTGRTFADIDSDEMWQRFNTTRSVTQPDGGELMLAVQHRAVAALLDLRRRYPDGNVVVVSHGDVIRSVLLFALGIAIDLFHRVEVMPARVSVVEMSEAPPRVLLMNGDNVSGIV
jgi:probable phosphoglycerate mutase